MDEFQRGYQIALRDIKMLINQSIDAVDAAMKIREWLCDNLKDEPKK